MTEGLLCLFVMPDTPSPRPSPARGEGGGCLFVLPAGPLCHARRLSAGSQGLALLFFLFVWPLHGRSHGFPITNVGNDRRGIEHGGHDGRPARTLCHARQSSLSCRRVPFVLPAGPLCHAAGPSLSCPPVSPITNVGDKVSGKPASCFVVPLFVWPLHGGSHGFPITNPQ